VRAIILMGVAGSGKTTVGQALSKASGLPFHDGDLYHPVANIRKMASGIPLTDEDRLPWLRALRGIIDEEFARGQSLIMACSALKRSYREILGGKHVTFVHLRCEYGILYDRLRSRPGHYFRPEMLQSQFDALEESSEALVIDASEDVESIVQAIQTRLTIQARSA